MYELEKITGSIQYNPDPCLYVASFLFYKKLLCIDT